MHATDPRSISAYPLRLPRAASDRVDLSAAAAALQPLISSNLKRCNLCLHRRATCMTVKDVLAPCSPCHYCNECFDMLHIAADGRRLHPEVSVYLV